MVRAGALLTQDAQPPEVAGDVLDALGLVLAEGLQRVPALLAGRALGDRAGDDLLGQLGRRLSATMGPGPSLGLRVGLGRLRALGAPQRQLCRARVEPLSDRAQALLLQPGELSLEASDRRLDRGQLSVALRQDRFMFGVAPRQCRVSLGQRRVSLGQRRVSFGQQNPKSCDFQVLVHPRFVVRERLDV